MWYETDQIVCIIWRFSKTNPLSCHSFCWKSMLHNPFWSLPCPLHGPFRDFKPRGLWLQTKILPWGSWGRWLTLISDPVLWETEQPWKKKHEFAEEDMEKSLKRKHGETFSDLHPKKQLAWQTTIGFISVMSSQDVLLMTSRMVEPALPILDESKEFFRKKSCSLGRSHY